MADSSALTPAELEHFAAQGWLLTSGVTSAAALAQWVDEVAAWPDDGPWLHHRELTDSGPQLCRTENFVPFHDGLRTLLTTGPMLATASALLGEPAVLYKEKINYKLPGGAGYAPHQDAPAYRFVETHVSCMVAVDDALVGNGCLEVVSGRHHELLPMDDSGCIRARRGGRARLGARGGAGGPDAVVPLAHAAPQRPQPRVRRRAERCTPPTTREPRATCGRPTTSRRRAELGGTECGGVADRRLPGPAGHMTAQSIDEVLDLLARYRSERYDEEICQVAARRADGRAGPSRRAPTTPSWPPRCSTTSATCSSSPNARGARDRTTDQRHEARGSAWLARALPARRHRADRPARAGQALPRAPSTPPTGRCCQPGSVASLGAPGRPDGRGGGRRLRGQPRLGGRRRPPSLGRPGQGPRPRRPRPPSPTARCSSPFAR